MHNKHLPKILIVEDDITTNKLLQAILSRAGFVTHQSFDIAGAMKDIHTALPDLILLDLTLPDGSGLDLCRKLQIERGNMLTPILFISSNDDPEVKVQAFASGGVDYITKPLSGPEVIARVKTHLRIKQLYESLAELQAEHIKRLASAQKGIMPTPADIPESKFAFSIKQINQAGGDFYDVIRSGENIYDYIIADARGHDLVASFWTASLKMLITEYATVVHLPLEIVYLMNNALIKVLPNGVFFTLLYARLNRQSGKFLLAHCGHPPAIFVPPGSASPVVLRKDSDILGAFSDPEFEGTEISVEKGSRILMFTDGLVELTSKREEGIQRISEAAERFRNSPLDLYVKEIINTLTENSPVMDDIVLIGIEV